MSVTICPHCRHRLDPNEDSIYCESCGGNILRPPAEPKASPARYTITVETEHPNGAEIVAKAGQAIAEDLGFAGEHYYDIDVDQANPDEPSRPLAGWHWEPNDDSEET